MWTGHSQLSLVSKICSEHRVLLSIVIDSYDIWCRVITRRGMTWTQCSERGSRLLMLCSLVTSYCPLSHLMPCSQLTGARRQAFDPITTRRQLPTVTVISRRLISLPHRPHTVTGTDSLWRHGRRHCHLSTCQRRVAL